MKKYIIYISIGIASLLAGLFAGKILFGESQSEISHQHEEVQNKEEIFTCSMHPQIRQDEPGICPICEMDLIPVGSEEDGDDPTVLKMTTEAVKLAQIATTPVSGNPGIKDGSQINVEGTVTLDESLTNVQAAHIGGRIDRLYVSFNGEYVRKGQLIATLYAAELLTATKELLTAVKNEAKFPGLKNAAIQKVKNWKISDEQIQKVIDSGKPIQDINLYADYSGYITQRLVSEGDHIKEGGLLYRLASTGRLWIEFNVFESDIPNVKVGQKVQFTGPALGSKSMDATISYIDPILDGASRSVIARAQVVNINNLLKPGMLVQGKITVNQKSTSTDELLIPKTAVLWTGEQSVVYVARESEEGIPEFQYRPVILGDQVGEYHKITSGLQAGEEVVTKGAFAIDAAAQLKNKYSMMNQNVSIKKDRLGNRLPDFTQNTPDEFKSSLQLFVKAYLVMKDALVDTDPVSTGTYAQEALDQLSTIPHVALEADAHEFWLDKFNALNSHLNKMINSTDVSEQRKQFEFTSELTIDLIMAYGMKDNQYYVQYCPMAFDNKGAEWISDETGIRNPYFGDKMLKCGQVTDTLGFN